MKSPTQPPFPLLPNRTVQTSRLRATATAAAIAVALAVTNLGALAHAAAAPAPSALAQATKTLAPAYRQQQWQRLAAMSDRDDLIAAVLLGMARADDQHPIDGHGMAEDRLAERYGRDPLALFALALACQQSEPCPHPESRDALVQVAPGNAVHWLLLPGDRTPDDAQLHAAARAPLADSHLRDIFRIVGKALAGQPAPALPAGVDPAALAASLRMDAVENVQLPKFDQVIAQCRQPPEPRRADCLTLGRRFEADRSGAILARMVGSAMVRRLTRGTPEETAAKQLRRDYVWMSERLEAAGWPEPERLKAEGAIYGEWNAWQRAVQRTGASATPAADWMPSDPNLLLLSEERKPKTSR